MKFKQKAVFVTCLFTLGTALYGCGASKRIESTEVPTKSESNETASSSKAAQPDLSRYIVRPHDNLWVIAGQKRVYGDSFEWPMIFKANRDQIHDPDLIYPRQVFRIEKGIAAEEMTEARKLAMETPKFVPHSEPRATLPVNYF